MITTPPQTRKKPAVVLLFAFPAYAVLGTSGLIFGFMPGWMAAFFSGSATLLGSFVWGVVFGLTLIAGMRLGRYFQEWLHGA